jgi:hypothetical protein
MMLMAAVGFIFFCVFVTENISTIKKWITPKNKQIQELDGVEKDSEKFLAQEEVQVMKEWDRELAKLRGEDLDESYRNQEPQSVSNLYNTDLKAVRTGSTYYVPTTYVNAMSKRAWQKTQITRQSLLDPNFIAQLEAEYKRLMGPLEITPNTPVTDTRMTATEMQYMMENQASQVREAERQIEDAKRQIENALKPYYFNGVE